MSFEDYLPFGIHLDSGVRTDVRFRKDIDGLNRNNIFRRKLIGHIFSDVTMSSKELRWSSDVGGSSHLNLQEAVTQKTIVPQETWNSEVLQRAFSSKPLNCNVFIFCSI